MDTDKTKMIELKKVYDKISFLEKTIQRTKKVIGLLQDDNTAKENLYVSINLGISENKGYASHCQAVLTILDLEEKEDLVSLLERQIAKDTALMNKLQTSLE